MSNTVKLIIGLLMVISGVILGLYIGLWVCFGGGIVDVIEQIRAENLEAVGVTWGIAKILLAGFFGWISALVLCLLGIAFIKSAYLTNPNDGGSNANTD